MKKLQENINTKKQTNKVSVLMTVYNAEKYVAEAIESILSQTFADFEFVIINDGSTDKSAEIVKSFSDERIIFIDNKINTGLVSVLNQGLGIVRGEYIARMDADDISMQQRFEKQVAFMDANPDVGVLGTNGILWDMTNPRNTHTYNPPENIDFLSALRGCRVDHPTCMIRKSLIDKYNFRYDKEYEYCEDYELWSRMIKVCKIKTLPEVLLKHRWHGENISIKKERLQVENSERVKQNMMNFLTSDQKEQKRVSELLLREIFAVSFDFFKIVKYESKTKVYFCYIPLIKIKKGWVRLFHVIPIFKLQGKR